jgi:hypothetical protein
MAWNDLIGPHTLMAVRRDVRHPFDANADGGAFQLDQGLTVFVFEDPSDGYRSSAIEPMVFHAPLYSFGCSPDYIRAPVLVRLWERSGDCQAEGIEIIDNRNGKVVLTAGTDNSDDYYPSFTFDWRPQDLADNAAPLALSQTKGAHAHE